VERRPYRLETRVVPGGMDAVGQQHDIDIALPVNPQRRPGEACVTDRAWRHQRAAGGRGTHRVPPQRPRAAGHGGALDERAKRVGLSEDWLARDRAQDGTRERADGSRGETVSETPGQTGELGEQTVVRPRIKELYSVEVWKDGVRENVVPITKPEITIGRGSRSITVDLPLKGDPEISRVHAILTREGDGRYYLQAKGRNSTLVGAHEVPTGERMEVRPDQKIAICNFVLRIQPN
jgi:hypothetical protein